MRVNYGRAPKGKTPIKRSKYIKSKNITVITPITSTSLFYYKILDSSVNKQNFKIFLRKIIRKIKKEKIKKPCLIMDNLKVHKNHEIMEYLKVKKTDYKFLPPYSPFLNPIENFFSKWKNYVKREESNNEEELFQNIKNIKNIVEINDLVEYYNKMKENLFKCLNKEVFY